MDLTRQPPRRPSNTSIAGIVNLARMADKARAYNDETLGEFLYGDNSGLDKILLDFLGTSHDDFADAAERYDDEDLGHWIRKTSGKTDDEIEAFTQHHLNREPGDEASRQRLEQRVQKHAPERTDIKTVFQSIELDDWASFCRADLTQRAPWSPYRREIAGIYGLARMADKARADKTGLLGDYIYNCPIDQAITAFLGITAEDYREAAYLNPNDLELTDWVQKHTRVTPGEISAFNYRISRKGPETDEQHTIFQKGLDSAAPGRTDITTWFDLLDLDDEKSFNTIDLSRHAPRSPYDTSVGGIYSLARLIDKGRATLSGTPGDYWYGEDSGIDRNVLKFLGISAQNFLEVLKKHPTDNNILAWLETQGKKSESEITDFNHHISTLGPNDEKRLTWYRGVISKLDASRTDVTTYFALMQLDDRINFARLKTGV